jgi:glycosyltransferase involved in cell wall biosynthesis
VARRRPIWTVGEVGGEAKRPARRRRRLLFPIEWDEPFGLVMVEALATGTPVIGFRRASVPEGVEHGRPYVVDGIDGMVEAIRRIGEIDRASPAQRGGAVHRPPDGRRRRSMYRSVLSRTDLPSPVPGRAPAAPVA